MDIVKKGPDEYSMLFKAIVFPLTEFLISKGKDMNEIRKSIEKYLFPSDRISDFLKKIQADIEGKSE